MTNGRSELRGPMWVLAGGVLGALCWTLVAWIFASNGSVAERLAAGLAAAASATFVSLIMAWRSRHDHRYLVETEHQANHDTLTGLTNRIGLFRELGDSIDRAKTSDTVVGVLFLDLDRFKVINDSMGHDAGDELLRIIAARLEKTVRSSDIVGRFGGDEFVVVCRDLISEASVTAVAKSILKAFTEPVSLRGGSQVMSTSIGIAVSRPGDVRSAEDLIRDADAAMYKAKKAKSGYAIFDDEQRKAAVVRLDTERDLTSAFSESQFVVHYQPLVDVRTQKLSSFEALIRWNHPTRGLLGPGAFLPVAEEAAMMARLGELVLREACAQLAVWNHQNPGARNVRIGVNVAEQQLLDNTFPFLVSEVLSWSGLPPSQLTLEITEDVIVDHLDGLNVLRELRALGVRLAIDDFGTGQSSLSYIKQFDMVESLKIDKSFVHDMRNGAVNTAIIDAIVSMATALGLTVVAEGVETPEQARQLMQLGVDIQQGYLFNPPVPADKINPAAWFRNGEAEAAPQPVAAQAGSPPPSLIVPGVQRSR